MTGLWLELAAEKVDCLQVIEGCIGSCTKGTRIITGACLNWSSQSRGELDNIRSHLMIGSQIWESHLLQMGKTRMQPLRRHLMGFQRKLLGVV